MPPDSDFLQKFQGLLYGLAGYSIGSSVSGLDSQGGLVRVAHGSCLLPIAAGSARVPPS